MGGLGTAVVTGAVTGVIGGATYNATESILSGDSAGEVVKDTLTGGLLGGITGGATGALGYGVNSFIKGVTKTQPGHITEMATKDLSSSADDVATPLLEDKRSGQLLLEDKRAGQLALPDKSSNVKVESSKAEILAKNRETGRAFEKQEFAKFSSEYNNSVQQITIKTPCGVKTRVDAIGLDTSGNVVINEFKSSATATLTSNQKIAFPQIMEEGGTVVGKGKGIFTGGYQIPAGTEVKIIRPK